MLPAGATLITDPEALVIGFLGAPTAEALEAELAEAEAEAGIEREESDEAPARATSSASRRTRAAASRWTPPRVRRVLRDPLSESTTPGGAGTAGAPGRRRPNAGVRGPVPRRRAWAIPGPATPGNRHNVGAMVLDELAARAGIRLVAGQGRALARRVR